MTHPRSTLRMQRRLMRLRSGHVTLLGAEFQPRKLSPQSHLWRRAASRWALVQISSFFYDNCCVILHGMSQNTKFKFKKKQSRPVHTFSPDCNRNFLGPTVKREDLLQQCLYGVNFSEVRSGGVAGFGPQKTV